MKAVTSYCRITFKPIYHHIHIYCNYCSIKLPIIFSVLETFVIERHTFTSVTQKYTDSSNFIKMKVNLFKIYGPQPVFISLTMKFSNAEALHFENGPPVFRIFPDMRESFSRSLKPDETMAFTADSYLLMLRI